MSPIDCSILCSMVRQPVIGVTPRSIASARSQPTGKSMQWLGLTAFDLQTIRFVLVQAFDRIQILRQRYRLPLSARDLDLRLHFHGALSKPASAHSRSQCAFEGYSLRSIKPPTKSIPSFRKPKRFAAPIRRTGRRKTSTLDSIEDACVKQDARLFEARSSKSRNSTSLPQPATPELIQSQSRVLGFLRHRNGSMVILSPTVKSNQNWVVENPEAARRFYLSLMKELAIDGSPAQAAAVINNLDWKASAKSLRNALSRKRLGSEPSTRNSLL